jgi:hypothetical protein
MLLIHTMTRVDKIMEETKNEDQQSNHLQGIRIGQISICNQDCQDNACLMCLISLVCAHTSMSSGWSPLLCQASPPLLYSTHVDNISSAGAAYLRFPCSFPVHSLSPTAAGKQRTLLSTLAQDTTTRCLIAC